jgi:hypothetical protein
MLASQLFVVATGVGVHGRGSKVFRAPPVPFIMDSQYKANRVAQKRLQLQCLCLGARHGVESRLGGGLRGRARTRALTLMSLSADI